MTRRTRSAGPRRRCWEIVTTLVLIAVVLGLSITAYAVKQAGVLDVRAAETVETKRTSSTLPASGNPAGGIGPEPSVVAAGASIGDLDRSYDLLKKESGHLKAAIEERGSRQGDGAAPRLNWPVDADIVISSGFGPRAHPILQRNIDHEGIDLALALSSPVQAAAGGEVIYASDLETHGTTLVIDHGGGVATVYCHLIHILAGEGTEVQPGQVVAESGMTGLATGPHVHFEVRIEGEPENPTDFLPEPAS